MAKKQVLERARHIRLAIFDVDGVLTDGTLYISPRGEEFKAFNILDGHGLKMLKASGVELAIITGRKSTAVAVRASETGITHVIQGARDKLAAYLRLLTKTRFAEHQTAYMGDDLPDLPILRRCGLAIGVRDCDAALRANLHYITARGGGRGAVREACELIMRAQGTLDSQIESYLA